MGTPEPQTLAVCACGCDWFVLTGIGAPDTLPNGGVNINTRGRILTHMGGLVCARCSAPFVPDWQMRPAAGGPDA